MPLYNPETQTKECSKCHAVTQGKPEVDRLYFKVKAMKDGYATRCKKCYYIKDAPEVTFARQDAANAKMLTKMVEAEPIKERPAAKKVYTHTNQEIKAIEKSSGQKFVEWLDMGDSWVPRFAKVGT